MTKPVRIELITLDSKTIGAIMKDNIGYFYRPRRGKLLTKGKHDQWDGEYFETVGHLKKTLY